MTSNYPQIVAASMSETASRFALAEALATEIPEREQTGNRYSNSPSVNEILAEVRQEIIDAGAEPKSVETLRDYRLTALWVISRGGGTTSPSFGWITGQSFSSHNDARRMGLEFSEWSAHPVPLRPLRLNSLESQADSITDTQAEDAATVLFQRNPSSVARAVENAGPDALTAVVSEDQAIAIVAAHADQRERRREAQQVESRAGRASTGSGVSSSPRVEARPIERRVGLSAPVRTASESAIRLRQLHQAIRSAQDKIQAELETCAALSTSELDIVSLDGLDRRNAEDRIAELLRVMASEEVDTTTGEILSR